MLNDRPHRLRIRWLTLLAVALLLFAGVAFGGGAAADDPATGTPGALASASPATATTTTAVPAATGTATVAATDPAATGAAPSATAPTTDPAAGTAAAAPATARGGEDIEVGDAAEGGGPRNIVKVQNKTDNRLRVRGKIQVGHIPGDTATPENGAFAYASCTDCATFAIALQIALISRTASTIAPQNAAIAVNVECTNCRTVARAVQYVVQVDDPTQTPESVKALVNELQRELQEAQEKDATVEQTEARVNAVITQFKDLGQSLYSQRDERTDRGQPGATVPPDAVVLTPTPTGTPMTPQPTTGSATPAASATATP